MATFQYRAATRAGLLESGTLEAGSEADAREKLRARALSPIQVGAASARAAPAKAASRAAVARAISELATLLDAGLPLDRALAVCVDNIPDARDRRVFAMLHERVKQGLPLSRAMLESPGSFPPMAAAMAEAGEANGALGHALTRLADGLERGEALRRTVASASIYPVMLLVIATGVILAMLLWVVPQFEGLFRDNTAELPSTTRVVLAASNGLRDQGLLLLGLVIGGGVLAARWLRHPRNRPGWDRFVLTLPQVGSIVRYAETARFARVLGSLIDGGVPLPIGLQIAQRTIGNRHMADAIARVAKGLNEGGGLSGPLAATGVLPKVAISFLRTGEETARLGPMLDRLADMLDRDVGERLGRFIGILTPAITVLMGVIVATVIASIMSAILSFNELAIAS